MGCGIHMAGGKPPAKAEPGPSLDRLIGRDGVREMRIFQCVGTEMERDVESQYDYCGRSYERAKLMELVNDGFRTNGPGSDAQQTFFVDGQRPYNPMTMLLNST